MKRIGIRILKILSWSVGLVLLLLVGCLFLLRLPSVQQSITQKAITYISGKTHSRVEVKRVFIGFPKSVVVEGVFAEDQNHDTLLALGKMEVDVDMMALLDRRITINNLTINGLSTVFRRTLPDSSFNFDFLVKAFAGEQPQSVENPVHSNSKPFAIDIKNVDLHRVKCSYEDEVSGTHAQGQVGKLTAQIDAMDLPSLIFKVNEIELANAQGVFEIRKTSIPNADTTEGSLPVLGLNRLKVHRVNFGFHSIPDSSFFDFKVGNLVVSPHEIDLNKQIVSLNRVDLVDSDIRIKLRENAKSKPDREPRSGRSPGLTASVKETNMQRNHIAFDVTNVPKTAQGIDYKHLKISNFSLGTHNLFYSESLLKGHISNLTFSEQCGLQITHFSTRFTYDSTRAQLADLLIKTPQTRISRHLEASYPSLSALSKDVGCLRLKGNLDSSHISLKDVLLLAPELEKQPLFHKNRNLTLALSGQISGLVRDLQIQNLDARLGNTKLALSGNLKGLPDTKKLWLDVQLKPLLTSRKELQTFLPKNTLPQAIRLPDQLALRGNVRGSLQNLAARLHLQTTDGSVAIKGNLKESGSAPTYTVTLVANRLHVGRILKQEPFLGELSGTFSATGRDFNPEKMAADFHGIITRLDLNGYSYRDLTVLASANRGKYGARVQMVDPNIAFDLSAGATLHRNDTTAFANLTLGRAHLQPLKLYPEDIKASFNLEARVKNFNPENLYAKLKISQLQVLKDNRRQILDSIVSVMENEPGRHSFSIESDLLELAYRANISPDKVVPTIQHYLEKKVANQVVKGDTGNPNFSLQMELKPHPILSDGFLPDLKKFSGIKLESRFNRNEEVLHVQAHVNEVAYGNNTVESLVAKIDGFAGKITYDVSLKEARSGKMKLARTSLTGKIEDQITWFGLQISEPDTGDRLRVEGQIDQRIPHETTLRLLGNDITLNREKWALNPANAIRILPHGINIQQFEVGNGRQLIKAQSDGESVGAPVQIQFQEFEIGTLSRIVETDTALVRGLINGRVHLKKIDPFAFTSDLQISRIMYQNMPVGDLKLQANNLTANRYDAKAVLSGDSNQLILSGYYQNDHVDFDVDIGQLRMKSVEAFASTAIRQSEGYLTGKLDVTGKATEPKIDGFLTFMNARFNLVAANNTFLLKSETVKVDNQGFHFQDFTVLDPDKQPLQVNGSIWSSQFSDVRFELDVTTQNFKVLNTTASDNAMYYGTLVLNSLIKIRGDKNLPIISANAKLLDGSKFTFVVLESDLKTDRGEGVVAFEDSTQWGSLPLKDTLAMKSTFRGVELTANLEVNKSSVFRVIVDPESGDNLEVNGDATLAFSIDQGGKISLSGTYELSGGHYQASFQKVLKREFFLKPGSRITWSGDPFDGQIDLTAVYKTKASATDLLSTELAGLSETERMAYRKLLNYEVNLQVEGALMKPILSFSLDMPKEDQLAFGGLVYAKVNVLNTDPNELNKQVFSLLVLNKFLPTGASSSPGATSAVTTVARNSVNQMLTDQLNALSGRYIKGAELNFNLQTTEDYVGGAAQENTALQVGIRKELFNNRLSIQVGSSIDITGSQQQANTTGTSNGQTLAGDVMVEYKLTEDGRYRLKAFRENQYEGVIDGILYKTGLGITYTRDYNHFRDLLGPVKNLDDNQYSSTKSKK